MTTLPIEFKPLSFAEVPGWREDHHLDALLAFLASAERLLAQNASGAGFLEKPTSEALRAIANSASSCVGAIGDDPAKARAFFETHFQPHRVIHDDDTGLLTGYYEPVLKASKTPTARYSVPLLRRPDDLINLVSEADRGQFGDELTHARQTDTGVEPYSTRAEIEGGALDEQNLAFAWLECPVEAYFLHVEGSGQLEFEDDSRARVTYDGKNGHPYTSIGKALIDDGVFEKQEMSFAALKAWLLADKGRAVKVFQKNQSYIFFRPLGADEPDTALGVQQIPLQPLRSLAVDTTYHEIGTPIFVVAPELRHAEDEATGFAKLMVAHDVGSAIRGPERGDIFFGTGAGAGEKAGQTVHRGSFYVLKPKLTIPSS